LSEPSEELPPGVDAGWRGLVASFGALAAGEGAARALGFVAVALLARRLGVGAFGLVTLGVSLVSWFALVVDAGTETLNIREVSRAPHRFRELADPVLGLRLVLSTAAAIAFVGGAFAFASSAADRSVLVRFAVVLPAIALNLRWMTLGIRGARAIAIGNVFSRMLFVAGVVLLVHGKHDVFDVPWLEAVAEAGYALAIVAVVSRRFGIPRPAVDLAAWRATLRQSFPLLVSAAARATVLVFDVFLIELLLGPSKVGYYGAALKPVVTILGVLGLLAVSFLSAFSSAPDAAASRLFRRTTRLVVAASLPLAIAISAASPLIVRIVYGHGYPHSVALLSILAWVIPVSALGVTYSTALIARERQVQLMWINLASGIFSVAADLAAIPTFGTLGAAVVRIVTAILGVGLMVRFATAGGSAPSLAEVVGWSPRRLEDGHAGQRRLPRRS